MAVPGAGTRPGMEEVPTKCLENKLKLGGEIPVLPGRSRIVSTDTHIDYASGAVAFGD